MGGALAASAGTVICGLGLMAFAEFAKVRSGGPAIAIGLAVALAASLTLAPALLRILGPAVFWPVGLPKPGRRRRSREPLWGWLSRQVTAHPVAIWVTSVAGAVAAGRPRLPGAFRLPGHRRAGAGLPERAGLAAVERHFNAGEVGPVTVLLESHDRLGHGATAGR